MESVFAPTAGKVVECSSNLIRETSYIFCYKSKAKDLEFKVQILKYARLTVQSSVDAATRNGEEILQHVKNWLNRASRIAPEEGLEDARKSVEEKAKYLFGFCPNLKVRYELSKKADREIGIVVKLLQEAYKFQGKVSQPAGPDPKKISAASSNSYMAFESRKSTLNKILEALRDADLERIGVYGIAGVGKTTLVKQVAEEAKACKLFDVVAFAVVTLTPDVEKIQREIAEFLSLKFDEESVAGRASRLSTRLKKEKKVLVILDDIRTSLKLEDIGISFEANEHGACKVLLTSRDHYVLREMNAERSFQVHPLQGEEAWNLFKKMAGDIVENPRVQPTATDTCRRCAALPIFIVTAAKALEKTTFPQGKTALKQLTGPSQTMPVGPHSVIELTYYHLSKKDKSAFRLCSLMPYNATIFDLLKYGVAAGLLRELRTMEEARQRLHILVRNLKSFGLLLDDGTAEEFTVHDAICNAAASIASWQRQMFFMRNGIGARELPDAGKLRMCTCISLIYNDSLNLPDQLESPNLIIFQLYNKKHSLRISDNFFTRTKALKVVDLKGMQLLSLPLSLGSLRGLRTLCLESCLLQDIVMVGKLKKLQILSFKSSMIEMLPKEIGQLTQLKLLNLDNCSKLRMVPPNVISNLSQLEELYMGNSFAKWDDKKGESHASLRDLKFLVRLTSLNMHIPDSEFIREHFFSIKLQRHTIFMIDPLFG